MGVNPDIEEAFALRGWCDASGAEQSFQANSNSMPAGLSSGGFNRAEMRNLNDAKESRLTKSITSPPRQPLCTPKPTTFRTLLVPLGGATRRPSRKILAGGVRNVMRVSMLLNTGKCSSKREICSEFEIRFSSYAIPLAVADWSGQVWL
jgi:replication factor A1